MFPADTKFHPLPVLFYRIPFVISIFHNEILDYGSKTNRKTCTCINSSCPSVRQIKKKLTKEVIRAGRVPTTEAIYSLLIERARANMHLVVCMSPIGDAFRNRLRQYPSLINCTTIDWFLEWPREALLEVGNKFLMNLNLTLTITGENKAVGLRLRLLPPLSGRSIPFDSDFSGIETPPLKRKREGRLNHIYVLSISWNPIIFLSTTHPRPVWRTSFRNAIVENVSGNQALNIFEFAPIMYPPSSVRAWNTGDRNPRFLLLFVLIFYF